MTDRESGLNGTMSELSRLMSDLRRLADEGFRVIALDQQLSH